ncbi:GIP [Symbiodinium sp. CCMP2456]|nr:GIP [Symbiodinium sp. CCMP2456]
MYGAVGELANGVVAVPLQSSTTEPEPSDVQVSPLEPEGALAAREQAGVLDHELQVAMEDSAEGAVQVSGQALMGSQTSMAATVALQDGSVHGVSANMEVQQGTSALTVVRWISRLNDFLTNQGQSVLGFLRGLHGFMDEEVISADFLINSVEGTKAHSTRVIFADFLVNSLEGTRASSTEVIFMDYLNSD